MKHEFSNNLDLPDLTDIETSKVYRALLTAAIENNLPVAWYRLPGEANSRFIVSMAQPNAVKADLEELPEGFIFAPFTSKEEKALFLTADLYFFNNSLQINYHKTAASIDSSIIDDFLRTFKRQLASEKTKYHYYISSLSSCASTSKEDYVDAVDSAIKNIEKEIFQKVVLSKTKVVALPESFEIVNAFEKLSARYPHAFVSFVSTPQTGSWMGASPEILISVNRENQFHTVALAGTQVVAPEANLKKVAWTEKEIEEQAMVSRYIINSFKKIRLREFEEQGPRTARAGSLAHLRSDFWVDMITTNFPQLGTVMLELLHPTSAVCGMPKKTALDFVINNEKHDRQFYSGYLGPVHIEKETHLYVNLRCMQLLQNQAILYAGAGITSDSDPASEWMETEIKCNTMMHILQ